MAEEPKLPKKRDYRQRAHCNPLSDRHIPYPLNPSVIDWSDIYPFLNSPDCPISDPKVPTILDIGCGYGGMSFATGKECPHNLVLGFEIRCTVTTYVEEKIRALRAKGEAQNVAVQYGNTMRTLMRYISPHTIEKIFILFPDPHFKKRKAKWRIISSQLMDEYGFIMKEGGKFYLVTDVLDYFNYAVPIITDHPLFQRIPDEDVASDPILELAKTSTEESHKVDSNNGSKYAAVFLRITPPE